MVKPAFFFLWGLIIPGAYEICQIKGIGVALYSIETYSTKREYEGQYSGKQVTKDIV
jgi:hypothetical protein